MNHRLNSQGVRWPLQAGEEKLLCRYFCMLLRCDNARLSSPLGTQIFLIIGTKRNTRQDYGVWKDQNGRVKNWDYLAETCIASGNNVGELIASAKQYRQMVGKTVLDLIKT